MEERLSKSVDFFVFMQPNLDDIHHPMDIKRVMAILINSIVEHEDFPYEMLRERLATKKFTLMTHGTIDSFIQSIEELVNKLKPGLVWAYNEGLLDIKKI